MVFVENDIKHVCIVGAGAIGSLYAGHLGSVAKVSVLTRREEHAARLKQHGLRVSGKSQQQVNLAASTNPGELEEADLIIIATKTIDVESSMQRLRGYSPKALVMLVQNGLGCEELVARNGVWPVLSAVTFMAGTRHSDVHVEYELDTATWIGPWAGAGAGMEDARRVAELLGKSGLLAEAFEDLLPVQWSKLIFNAAINSICAITDLPFSQSYVERKEVSDLGHLVYGMVAEGGRVASELGISLYRDPWEMVLQAATQCSKEAGDGRVPSMQADVRAKQPTEVDWITGAIVRAAQQVGISVPLHETLYRLIKARETSWKIQDIVNKNE